MSNITANELPTPIIVRQPMYAPVPVAPLAPVPSNGRRRVVMLAAAGLAALAIGGYAVRAQGSDSSTTTSAAVISNSVEPTGNSTAAPTGGGSAGNSSLTAAELDNAYQYVLGVQPSTATVACLDAAIGTNGGPIAKFAQGETLPADQAGAVFTPFATCAPDNDFLGLMLPVTMDALQQQADQACVSQGLTQLSLADRVTALQLAYSDAGQRANVFITFFEGCLF